MEVEWRTSGFDSFEMGIRGINEDVRGEIQDTLMNAARVYEREVKENIPRQDDRLYDSIRFEPLRWSPGGAGGGGEWTLAVNIGGTPETEHLEYVVEGTGMWGIMRRPYTAKRRKGRSGGKKRRRSWPGYMHFFWKQRGNIEIYARQVKGQEPQRDWIAWAQYQTNLYIAERIERLDLFRQG